MASLPVTSWFRSAEMQYISLIVQGHVAHDTLEALGDLGAISFHDLNPDLTPFQRRFTKHIRRCDELERIIRYFEDEMGKYEVKPQVRRLRMWFPRCLMSMCAEVLQWCACPCPACATPAAVPGVALHAKPSTVAFFSPPLFGVRCVAVTRMLTRCRAPL
jgi:hypothetical protein